MPTLLIVHHTPSPATHELLTSVRQGAGDDAIEDVDTVVVPALAAGPADVLAADGILVGTTANIGYMAGAVKHFFDQIYYPCLDACDKMPWGLWVHGNDDTTGAVRSVTTIATALGWRAVADPVTMTGTVTPADLEACWNLGATVAATLAA